jgi:uncharacterized protein
MAKMTDIERKVRELKAFLRSQFHVKKIGIFGSYARGENREDSDIDILVELDEPLGLKLIDLKEYLEESLGASIDLATTGALKPAMREEVLKEVQFQ